MIAAELTAYIDKVNRIVAIEDIGQQTASSQIIEKYYSDSGFFYRKFHSPEGAMHLPVSFSEQETHKNKLLFQARTVHQAIKKYNYLNILELGCGMGYNSRYLGDLNPKVRFTGIDLTKKNIDHAKRSSTNLKNVCFLQADFDTALDFSEPFDLIFGVETLCHSKNINSLIQKLESKLKKGGRVIIFDGYEKPGSELLNDAEKKAYQLLCWGFALDKFQSLEELSTPGSLKGLVLEELAEYSTNVLPNFKTFQKAAKKLLNYPLLTKVLLKTRMIPLSLFKQSLAGLFGPYLIEKAFLGYYKLVLKKV